MSATASRAGGRAEISVDWDEPRQTIVGFGGTMGWIHPAEDVREEVLDLLFTKLGASVLRIRALGGEEGDESSLEPENDNGDPAAFDWARFPISRTEAKNAALIKGAVERGVRTVVPAAWSPPGWMKTTGLRAGGGTLKGDILEEFAELWAAYVVGMKREFDIDIRHVSIQNEPDLTYYYPTCRFEPREYGEAVRAVRERLARDDIKTLVVGPDTCRIYNMPEYLGELERAGYPRGLPILTHLYDLGIPYEKVGSDPARWRRARDLARERRRPLWFMETANYLSRAVEKGSYEEAIIWARKMHHALADGDCEVVCYWSLFFDKKGEALVHCAESGSAEYEITPKLYTSMNYFRFVRPGMVRVAAACRDADVFVTAFRAPATPTALPPGVDRDGRVVVAVNWAGEARRVRLPGINGGRWTAHVTTESRECESAGESAPEAALPARSVTTFVGARPATDRAAE